MSFRRRYRWFRRLTIGLALATVIAGGRVSVAAAKFDDGAGVQGVQQQSQVVRGESADSKATAGTAIDPYRTGTASTRPDDLAARFAHSSVTPQPVLASSRWTFDQDEALGLGLGAIVLGLGLGLALGHLRRPRLAGL